GAGELRPGERLTHARQPRGELVEVRNDDADDAAEHLGIAGRHVELLLADVDPHVGGPDHDVGIAGEPHPGHPEVRRRQLARDLHVDVLELDDVAHVLRCAIVLVALHRSLQWMSVRYFTMSSSSISKTSVAPGLI